MPNWIPLSRLADQCSDESLQEFIRENPIRLRGEYCVDFTYPGHGGRSDPIEIPRDFILNAKFSITKATLTADPDYAVDEGETNYSIYEHVAFFQSDLQTHMAPKRGRRPVHDWDAIIKMIEEDGPGWKGSQNEFIQEIRRKYMGRNSSIGAPDDSTIKKKLKSLLHISLAGGGA